jgi:hypothetical protein
LCYHTSYSLDHHLLTTSPTNRYSMKSFSLLQVSLLLSVLHASSAFVPLSTRSRARTPHTIGVPSFSSGPSPASAMGTVSIAHDDAKSKSSVVLTAKKIAKKGKAQDEEPSEKGGMETKYKIGWGIVAFGLLYDFFVTHGGVAPWQDGGVW